jgi:hypothetical protein
LTGEAEATTMRFLTGTQLGVSLLYIVCGIPKLLRKLGVAPTFYCQRPITRLLRGAEIGGATGSAMGHKPNALV